MRAAAEKIRGKKTRHISRLHAAVGNTAARSSDLHHRLEPKKTARTITDDAHVGTPRARLGIYRARDGFGAQGERTGIARHVDVGRHVGRSRAATMSSKLCAVTRPKRSPSIIMAGEQAQFPRQYTGSSVKAPLAVVS